MNYTCSCCKHVEYRELIGGNAYYCTAHNDYMYPGSTQCEDFELKPRLLEHNQDKEVDYSRKEMELKCGQSLKRVLSYPNSEYEIVSRKKKDSDM